METKGYRPKQRGPMGRGGAVVEKPKDLVGIWKKLLGYCRKYGVIFVIAMLCAIVGTVCTLIGPDRLSDMTNTITDGIMGTIDMDKIAQIGFTLVALYALSYVLSAVQGWIMSTITQRISRQMRSDISYKINRLPMSYYNKTTTGDVLSRVTNDVDTIGQSLNQSIGTLITAVILFVGSLFMMIKTNGVMTLTAVGASLIGFVIMFSIMGRSQKYFRRQQEHLGEINGYIEEIYAGHTVVKAYNGEAKAQQEFDRMNDDLRESAFRAQCLSGLMMPIMNFIGNLGYVAVCVVGGAMALDGKISFGVIVAFMMYVRYFTQPLSQIAQAIQSMQSAGAAGERVFAFLEADEMEDESGKIEHLDHVKGEVTFEHVKFGYDDGGHLSELVRKKPYSVVLFDEIEKAHPDVFNLMLQIFDDGRLTDSKGRTVDFKNTVIIMTSNIGSEIILEDSINNAGGNFDETKEKVMAVMRERFKPEFLNRVDETIFFKALTMQQLSAIVDIQMDHLRKLLADRNITFEITDDAKEFLARRGFNPIYGARPLKRVIRQMVENPLSKLLLAQKFIEGDNIKIDVKDDEIVFDK